MNVRRRKFLEVSTAALGGLGLSGLMSRQALAQGDAPKRVIVWWVPEGCVPNAFWPRGGGDLNIDTGAGTNGATYSLQPLKELEKEIILIKGFRNNGSNAGDPHRSVMDTALGSGPNGESIDQMLGQHLKGDTPFHSIISTLFGGHNNGGGGYLTPTRLAGGGAGASTWNPITTYNQVFPGVGGGPAGPNHALESKLRLVGAMKERIQQVRCQGGDYARTRLESYLTSIETIESQTQALVDGGGNPVPQDSNPGVSLPDGWDDTNNPDKYWVRSDNFAQLVKIQIDTTVAALALDRTRVSFMQFNGSGNNKGMNKGTYDGLHYRKAVPGLEGNGVLNDHRMGHGGGANQARVFRWYYEQLAYLVGRLKATPDTQGTLYDNTLIFTATEFGSTNHKKADLPYLLIGNPGGAFKNHGKFMTVNGRSHADLLLAISKGMGMDINQFGGSSNPYNDILA